MKSAHALGLAAAAALALVAGVYFSNAKTSDPRAKVSERGPLLPQLAADINRAAELHLQSSAGALTVRKDGERWVLPEQGGYPADLGKVREFLVRASRLERVERKTQNPARFGELGLLEPAEGADAERVGTKVQVRGADGAELAAWIFGREASGSGFERQERFARLLSGGPAYLVEGRAELDVSAASWMAKDQPKLPRAEVTSVEVLHPDGERVGVQNGASGWELQGMPEGRELAWAGVAGSLGGVLENLSPEGARARADVAQLDGPEAVVARVRGAKGLVVEVRSVEIDGESWVGLSAKAEPVAIEVASDQTPADAAEPAEAEGATETDGQGEEAPAAPPPLPSVPTLAIQPEAEEAARRWNEAYGAFALRIPTWTAGNLRKRMEELLKPLDAAPPGADVPADLQGLLEGVPAPVEPGDWEREEFEEPPPPPEPEEQEPGEPGPEETPPAPTPPGR